MESLKQTKNAADLDINVAYPDESPTDTVSSISWTPSGNNLTFATSDWASYIRIYDLDPEDSTLTQKACFDAKSPCLSVKWHENEKTIFAGCTDGSIKSYDIASGGYSEIGRHEGPVKSVHWLSSMNTLLTLSFDKTLRFWDPREAKHVAGFRLHHKVYCSDVLFPYLAIGLSEAKCLILDLTKTQAELNGENGRGVNYLDSPLGRTTQITSIKFFSDKNLGFGMSGNDGRCHIASFKPNTWGAQGLESIMTFKAHKIDRPGAKQIVYPVHTIGFHPNRGSEFVYTIGGEGKMIYWDRIQKSKTAEFDFNEIPITQAEVDPTGKYMAYSLGYDWARGVGGYMSQPSRICVHKIRENELKYMPAGTVKYP